MASLLSSSTSLFSSSSTRMICSSLLKTKGKKSAPAWTTLIRAVSSAEPDKEKETVQATTESAEPPQRVLRPKKPEYSMKKGQIVRVDKEKYLNSINYLSVGHPPYYKGLDYIYEDRGEVLDIRIFETGEYALIAWVGIPTAPAWLPTDMLIKSDQLNYERF